MTAGGSSLPEVQQLLSVLAAGRRAAEVGTAVGMGAAAIASTAASLVTVEIDPVRAGLAAARLAGLENVELIVGDWRDALPPRAPFELLFLDGGAWKADPSAAVPLAVGLLEAGGLLVCDDFTPDFPGPDPARMALFGDAGLVATEVLVRVDAAVIVAARR